MIALLALAACSGGDSGGIAEGPAGIDTTGLRTLAVPAEFQRGKELFNANCATCHGEAALGTAQGPPLIHMYYEPNHHSDASFTIAVSRGVPAHHWGFGNMPPIPNLLPEDVQQIIGYVRWLQQEAGVF